VQKFWFIFLSFIAWSSNASLCKTFFDDAFYKKANKTLSLDPELQSIRIENLDPDFQGLLFDLHEAIPDFFDPFKYGAAFQNEDGSSNILLNILVKKLGLTEKNASNPTQKRSILSLAYTVGQVVKIDQSSAPNIDGIEMHLKLGIGAQTQIFPIFLNIVKINICITTGRSCSGCFFRI
jgi:hypothetical protein